MKHKIYTIVTDKVALQNFIDWLPNLERNEQYYLSLLARKKYCPDLIKSNDKTQLKRFTATKENMMDKILGLERPIGRWKLKGSVVASQESLVLYILPNPRDMKKANRQMGKKTWDLDGNDDFNLVAEAMSCVQRAKSYSYVVDFDIDEQDVDFSPLNDILPPGSYNILQTRGGYHLLVRPSTVDYMNGVAKAVGGRVYPKNWFHKIRHNFKVDQSGDQMIPVPGCVQGGFTPNFINL